MGTNLLQPERARVYISVSNIRASVETRPSQLDNLLYFSPVVPSLTFYRPPPKASRDSVIQVFLVDGIHMKRKSRLTSS